MAGDGIGYSSGYKGTILKEDLIHPEKYVDNKPIVYRSALEYNYFKVFDKNSGFLEWASESFSIPYSNPLKEGKISNYYPDVLVKMRKKDGTIINLLIEIKPQQELDNVLKIEELINNKKKRKQFLRAVQNRAKWNAAEAYCKKQKLKSNNNWQFIVMTDIDLKRFSSK
jgi:hypothetical protein